VLKYLRANIKGEYDLEELDSHCRDGEYWTVVLNDKYEDEGDGEDDDNEFMACGVDNGGGNDGNGNGRVKGSKWLTASAIKSDDRFALTDEMRERIINLEPVDNKTLFEMRLADACGLGRTVNKRTTVAMREAQKEEPWHIWEKEVTGEKGNKCARLCATPGDVKSQITRATPRPIFPGLAGFLLDACNI
jgi:hypothetical protein